VKLLEPDRFGAPVFKGRADAYPPQSRQETHTPGEPVVPLLLRINLFRNIPGKAPVVVFPFCGAGRFEGDPDGLFFFAGQNNAAGIFTIKTDPVGFKRRRNSAGYIK
jgi:hypothetical protein